MLENLGRSSSVDVTTRKSIYPRKNTGRSSSVTSMTAYMDVCLKISVDPVASTSKPENLYNLENTQVDPVV